MISIRLAAAADAGALHDVAAATFALACPPGTEQRHIDDFISQHLSVAAFDGYLADPQRQLFLASVDGTPSGYTMLVYGEPSDQDAAAALTTRPSVELSKVYTLPAAHGGGLAKELLSATLAAARARGAVAVWLGVNQLNERANSFYEKSGFTIVGAKNFTVGDEVHDDFVRELVFAGDAG